VRSIDTIGDMKAAVRTARSKEQRVGFVPTMGALHDGHLALVRRAKGLADVVVMSIFVNPAQFGAGEDYDRYPRDLARDAGLAAEAGVDILFTPSAKEIYPNGYASYVTVEGIGDRFEGAARPGHFRGVATVVLKLFQIVQPELAVFGQKDAQQLAVIRRIVHDLNLDVEVLAAQTVREKDGLALSSRNVYLSPPQREAARVLSASLRAVEGLVAEGETDARATAALLRERIGREPLAALDYADVVSPDEFKPVDRVTPGALAIVAAKFGGTRLIDNAVLNPPGAEGRP
jgi:pantoate--beta-alanine ligase